MINNLFKVTLIEVLPKERKQREEKVQLFGQATIDLLDLLKGHTDISLKLHIYPTPGSSIENLSASDVPGPLLEAKIALDQPLLADEDISKTNLMIINLESMYALPDTWTANANKEYAYSAALPLPVNDEVNIEIKINLNDKGILI